MKKMKQAAVLSLSLLLLVACLFGCGSQSSAAPAAPAATEAPAAAAPAADAAPAAEAPAAPADGPVMAKIKSAGKLVVGTEAQYAPYEFKDLNANFVGCDMFLAQKIADALGVQLEIVDMSFDGIIPAVQAGQVDLGIAAFTNSHGHHRSVCVERGVAALAVAAPGSEEVGLAGLKVGAQKGTIQSQLITSALPDSQLFELDKYPELALEVTNGNIAGLVVDSSVGDSIVANSNGALVVSSFQFSAEEASFGKSVVIAKGNEDLVAAVNEVIAAVLADGSYQAAYDEAVALAAQMGV